MLNRQVVPNAAAEWQVRTFDSPTLYLLGVNLFLFIVGMFVGTSASITALAPVLGEAAGRLGIDAVHFGTVMMIKLALGMIMPPSGLSLFAAAQVARTSTDKMMRHLPIFIGVIFACLPLITYMAALVFTLPNVVFCRSPGRLPLREGARTSTLP
jgi:TRAP-type C4-dicarboxylate transport system permease large subunit